jgi:predicted phage terminase large subunit-like protein
VKFDKIVISWDTATKVTELSDYSVGTVWGVYCGFYFLLDVIRDRLEFPALERKVTEVYNWWHLTTGVRPKLLIEDKGSGSALIQNLRYGSIYPYEVLPVGDKVMRMSAQSATIENGEVFLPTRAPWLEAFRTEVLAFPCGVYDDQVDSMSQALNHLSQGPLFGYIAV